MSYFCVTISLGGDYIAIAINDTNFNMRMNIQNKSALESLYSGLGMPLSKAVNIFFEKSFLIGELSFNVRLPRYNRETEDAIRKARGIMSGQIPAKSYGSVWESFDKCEAEKD